MWQHTGHSLTPPCASVAAQGLAALLVQGLSGCSPAQVASLSPDWIRDIGLQQSLTPSRNNGFFNMFALMRQMAAELSTADSDVSYEERFCVHPAVQCAHITPS